MAVPLLNEADSLERLEEILNERAVRYPTNKMDLLLLRNKNMALSEILKVYQSYPDKTNDFKSISIIKKHIKYREDKQKWKFKITGDPSDPVVQLVDFDCKKGDNIASFSAG